MRTRTAVLLSLMCGVPACATTRITPFQRAVRDGDEAEIVRMFDRDSALHRNEDALFHVAVARTTPGSRAYDLGRARAELDTLLALYPQSRHRPDALRLDSLIATIDRLSADTLRLSRSAAQLSDKADSLQARVADAHRSTAQLQADLKKTEQQLHDVQEELERLKTVDLRLARPRRR